jgi:hypothetical protein
VVNLELESWSALAPGLNTSELWQAWFADASNDAFEDKPPALKQIPALLRRRFSTLGKYAAASTLNLLAEGESLPSIFASRHGDTGLTLSLLQEIGQTQPISPTGFSLAVHNAVAGIISIARDDKSPITAISSMQGLLLQTLFEAIAQLESHPRVLCVIYDIPLPDLYRPYQLSPPFPFALSFIVRRSDSSDANLILRPTPDVNSQLGTYDEIFQFIKILVEQQGSQVIKANQMSWSLTLGKR